MAAEGGAELVVAVGGDSHAAAVAEGLVGTDTLSRSCPPGSADDYARSLGMPRRDLPAAVAAILAGRAEPCRRDARPDLSRRTFLNVIGTGFDAAVAAAADRM